MNYSSKHVMVLILLLLIGIFIAMAFLNRGPSLEETYKEAYVQVVEEYNAENSEYLYDLVDADGDEILELVITLPGYQTSLYTYEDGAVRCLMDHWPYGAMGNAGYLYAPGKGIYYNTNADYAGAIIYGTYMSKHETGELEADYTVKNINYDDIDGDGMPSDEELSASEDFEGIVEYYDETGAEIPESEAKETIDLYYSYEMEELAGVLSYESIIKKLTY